MNDARYLCQRCGNCCRWPGFVSITATEARRIADFLGITEEAFAAEYTELLASRGGLGIRSLEDGSCIFLEGKNHCRIQPVKPLQCKGFPNAWRFPGWREVCEALDTAEVAGSDGRQQHSRRDETGHPLRGAGAPRSDPTANGATRYMRRTAAQ